MAKKKRNKKKGNHSVKNTPTNSSSTSQSITNHNGDTPEKSVQANVSASFLTHLVRNESKTFFVFLLFSCLILVFGGFWFTGEAFIFKDIGSDSVNVFYTSYYWVADYIEKYGSIPTWSFASGLGQSIFFGSYGDPLLWLYYISGKEAIPEMIAYVEAIKFFLAGFIFYHFLRQVNLTYVASMVGGVMYAFSGFMAIGATWYVFSIQAVYFALYLLAFERLIQHKEPWLFILSVFLIAIQLPLDLFYAALLSATYGMVRLFAIHNRDSKKIAIDLGRQVIYGSIGVLLSMVMVLPTLHTMLNSPRVLGESSFFESLQSVSWFEMIDWALLETTFSRFLSSDLLKAADHNFLGAMNYLEAPAIYCGLMAVFFLVSFFMLANKSEKIGFGILLGLILIPLFFPYFRYAFWLFSGDYYRLYSLFVIIILLMIAIRGFDLWYQKNNASWKVYIVASSSFLLLLIWVNTFQTVQVNPSQYHTVVILGVLQLAVLGMVFIGKSELSKWLFLVLLSFELVGQTRSVFYNRVLANTSEFNTQKVGYNDYTKDATAYLASIDSSFYRVEKNYPSYTRDLILHTSTNDAKVQGYYGTKSYYSFNNIHYVTFLGELDIIDPKDESATRWVMGLAGRPLVNFLMGNKYFLTKSDPNQNMGFGYRFINQVGDVSIFTHDNHLPLGFVYPKMVTLSTFQQIDAKRINNVIGKKDLTLLKAVVIDDVEALSIPLPMLDTSSFSAYNYPFSELNSDVQKLKSNVFNIKSFRDDHIKGDLVNTVDGGVLFFSIPYDEGWKAFVNGKETDLMKVNVGFLGLQLNKGDFEIELIYTPPNILLGLFLSVLGVIFLLITILFSYKRGNTFDKQE